MENYQIASLLVVIGLILDKLDGTIARLTKTSNAFGGEFDTIADLFIYSMAPAFIAFFMFKEYNFYLAFFAGFSPIIFGSIRLARFNIKRMEYPGFWFGLPRFGSAIAIVAFLNSHINEKLNFSLSGIMFVIAVSIINIMLFPYFGHHNRKLSTVFKISFFSLVIILIVAIPLGFAWDVLFLYSLYYIISPIFYPGKEQRKKLKQFIIDWKRSEAE
jgi:CDP-diacylglycerol--serine O-phosphatidyltransferase